MTRGRADPSRRTRRLALDAPAKINLWLRVLGRDARGYHLLDTVFQTLELADRVSITCRQGNPDAGAAVELARCDGVAPDAPAVPTGADNLCVRAAQSYLKRWPAPVSLAIELDKRIPVAAGLGGGSSDAAAVLLGLRELLGRPRDPNELMEAARELGADVPFFLVGGTARGRDRGDRIEPLADLEPATVWLVAPRAQLSTAAVFAEYRRHEPERHVCATVPNQPSRGPRGREKAARDEMSVPVTRSIVDWILGNELETAARVLCPQIEEIYTVLQRFGFDSVQLSGSGGVVFGIPSEEVDRDAIARDLGGTGKIHVTRTLARRAIRPTRGL